MDGDGCSFFFTVPGWVPPLEAAVNWLDANTAIQTKKLVGYQGSNTNKKTGWMPTQQYKQKTGWMPTQQYKQKTGWMPTQQYKQKTGWMPTQQYKQKTGWMPYTAIQTKKLVGCQHSNANKKNWLDANTALQTEKTTTVG